MIYSAIGWFYLSLGLVTWFNNSVLTTSWNSVTNVQESATKSIAAEPTIRAVATQDVGDYRLGSFSAFLRETGRTSLWLDDVLARWRGTEVVQTKTRCSFEISLWLERELQQTELVELQKQYPQVWEGAHVQDRSFACVQLVELRQQLNKIAIVAFEDSLHDKNPETLLLQLAETQRRLRATADNLNQLLGDLAATTPSLQGVQLQQLQEAAETSLAWSYYYEWLLTPSGHVFDTERLKQATQIFMRLLGTTEPDLRPADWYQWFDPNRSSSNDLLLGLGLCSAALEQTDVASTCFATLQRQSDPILSQRIILWHTQGMLKRQRWDDARLLVSSHVQGLRAEETESLSSMVEAMLAWFKPATSPELPDDATDSTPTEEIAKWRWRLLEQLVLRGQVDEAARLMAKYSIRNPESGPAAQVLLLHQLLTRQTLTERSPQQLAQMANGLKLWTTATEPPSVNKTPREVQRWAQRWLIRVYLAQGEVDQAQELMVKFYEETPQTEGGLRQSVAWDLAQSFEQKAEVDRQAQESCLRWYREAASHPNLPQSAASQIKARLWELAGQPIAQTAYLRSISPQADGYSFARRQLIVRLFDDFREAARETTQSAATAATLEQEILDQLGLVRLDPQADDATVQIWQNQLKQCLSDAAEQGNDASSAALLAVWLQTRDMASTTNAVWQNVVLAISTRHAMAEPQGRSEAWRPILYSAAVTWDQNPFLANDESLHQTTIAQLLRGPLAPLQLHALLESHVPNLRRQWELEWKLNEVPSIGPASIKQAPNTARLQELYRRWWEAVRTDPTGNASRWVEQVQLNYAEFLWRIDEAPLAKQVLESLIPSTPSVSWRRQMARILTQLPDPKQDAATETLWNELTEQFPRGSNDWFEAKYYLLRALAGRDSAQAQVVYRQLQMLYPDFPTPWSEAYARLATQYHW